MGGRAYTTNRSRSVNQTTNIGMQTKRVISILPNECDANVYSHTICSLTRITRNKHRSFTSSFGLFIYMGNTQSIPNIA